MQGGICYQYNWSTIGVYMYGLLLGQKKKRFVSRTFAIKAEWYAFFFFFFFLVKIALLMHF